MAGSSTTDRGGLFSNHYVKIYFILLALLAVSIIGPELEILFVTLVTAFGVAVIKAWLVIKHFMHLTIERVVPKLFLAASVLLLALFWGGVAPDVQLDEGRNWENVAAKEATERGLPSAESHDEEGEHAEEEEHAQEGDHGIAAAGVSYAGLVPDSKPNDNLLPGGYNLAHTAFWSVVVLVAIGTNLTAIVLSIGLLLLAFETLSNVPVVRRVATPMLGLLLRLPGARRLQGLIAD